MDGKWKVEISKNAAKQIARLPRRFTAAMALLILDLKEKGPAQPDWPNYSQLKGKDDDLRHCHLAKNSKPTYVAIWQVFEKLRTIIFRQVKTHEKTDYKHIK